MDLFAAKTMFFSDVFNWTLDVKRFFLHPFPHQSPSLLDSYFTVDFRILALPDVLKPSRTVHVALARQFAFAGAQWSPPVPAFFGVL
jgi:hypothetical protein